MNRVVLDTNVVFAAFAARGLCESVFELCLEQHELIASEFLYEELAEKLIIKLKLPKDTVQDILKLYRGQTKSVEPIKVLKSACRDKDDLAVLGTSTAGKAEYLITGDKDLLTLGAFKGTRIVTPRAFYEKQC